MKVLILDGSPAGDLTSALLLVALQAELEQRAAALTTLCLREKHLSPCLGDFKCWVETPGLCHIHDDGRALAQAVHDAEAVVLFGPSSFGGYCSGLKRGLDRLISLITPFFETRAGEIHHLPRYARSPRLVGLAWTREPTAAREQVFAELVESNAVNFSAPRHAAALVGSDPSAWREPLARLCDEALAPGDLPPRVEQPEQERAGLFAAARAAIAAGSPPALPARATLLVGSARPSGASTSEALGRGLLSPLAARGAEVRVQHAVVFEHAQRIEEAARELLSTDLLVISTPLYVDSLPFLVTLALEAMAKAHVERPKPRLAAIVNCGFPEAAQCKSALAIARAFAEENGLEWAGGLALGGGEALHGRAVAELHGPFARVRAALATAGEALADSAPIPDPAIAELAQMLMPSWMYRMAGNVGNRWAARRNGLREGALLARPFDEVEHRQGPLGVEKP